MHNKVVTPKEAINNLLLVFHDVCYIKSLERNLTMTDAEEASNTEHLTHNSPVDDEDDYKDNPSYNELRAAQRNENERIIDNLRARGNHPDGLRPITILLGNYNKIHQMVLEPFKSMVLFDCHYGWDIEFKEIESSQLTESFVEDLPRPSGKDGGVLIIKGLTSFSEMYGINEQTQLVRDIMVNKHGVISTGWRIIFTDETVDKDIEFLNSFINNWTKDNPHLF